MFLLSQVWESLSKPPAFGEEHLYFWDYLHKEGPGRVSEGKTAFGRTDLFPRH